MPGFVARTVALLGALTYPLYLWHEPVFGALSRVLAQNGDLFAVQPKILAVLITTLVLAYFTYVAVELPAVRWRRSGRPRVASTPTPEDAVSEVSRQATRSL